MLRHVVRLAVAALAVAAAGVVVSGSPAGAATCGSAAGVSVVVDFHQLSSRGPRSACDQSGAGEYASAQFADVGFTLTYVQNEAFVCQVDGLGSPQCARTPPADAYWSLWWSDGRSGTWNYASVGVTSLKVPAGGYVALSWQKGDAQVPPRVKPTAHGSSPPTSPPASSPTSHPTSSAPSSHPTRASSGPSTSATTSTPATPSGSPPHRTHRSRATASPRPHHHPSGGPSTDAAGPLAGVSSSGTSGGGSGGVPGWVALVAVVAVFVAGGAVTLARRRRSGGP